MARHIARAAPVPRAKLKSHRRFSPPPVSSAGQQHGGGVRRRSAARSGAHAQFQRAWTPMWVCGISRLLLSVCLRCGNYCA